MSGGNPSRYVSPAAVNLRSERDETLVFESRFESANLAKAVQVYVFDFVKLLESVAVLSQCTPSPRIIIIIIIIIIQML